MSRWFPRILGVVLFLCPLGCRQYRENWCMDHGYVPANQAHTQAQPPVIQQPVVYSQPAYQQPVYAQPGYGGGQICYPPAQANICPPGTVPVAGQTTWNR